LSSAAPYCPQPSLNCPLLAFAMTNVFLRELLLNRNIAFNGSAGHLMFEGNQKPAHLGVFQVRGDSAVLVGTISPANLTDANKHDVSVDLLDVVNGGIVNSMAFAEQCYGCSAFVFAVLFSDHLNVCWSVPIGYPGTSYWVSVPEHLFGSLNTFSMCSNTCSCSAKACLYKPLRWCFYGGSSWCWFSSTTTTVLFELITVVLHITMVAMAPFPEYHSREGRRWSGDVGGIGKWVGLKPPS
jgi:hypothetical protein